MDDTTEIVAVDVVVDIGTTPTTQEALEEEDAEDTAAIALVEGETLSWIPKLCWCDKWLPLLVAQESSRT